MNPPRILFVAAVLLFFVGLGIAIVQPGDLGDDTETETATPTTQTTSAPSSTLPIASDDGSTTTTVAGTTDTTADPAGGDDASTGGDTGSAQATSTTTAAPPTTAAPTTAPPVTSVGSGAGATDTPVAADTANGLADTGGETMMLAAVGLGLAGEALRRRSR